MVEIVAIYLGCGLLLALVASKRPSSEDMDARHWAYLVGLWPHYVALALPAICRAGLAGLRARLVELEVRLMKRLLELAVRRVQRHGYRVEVVKGKTDGKE